MADRPAKHLPGLAPPHEKNFETPKKTLQFIEDLIRSLLQTFKNTDTQIEFTNNGNWPNPFPTVAHLFTGQNHPYTYGWDVTAWMLDFGEIVYHTVPSIPFSAPLAVTLTTADMNKIHANHLCHDDNEGTPGIGPLGINWTLPSDAKKGDVVGFARGAADLNDDRIYPASGKYIDWPRGRIGTAYHWRYLHLGQVILLPEVVVLVSHGDGNWSPWHIAYYSVAANA